MVVKIQNLFAVELVAAHARRMVIERAPLEDELGDVLDKALLRAGLTAEGLAEQVEVEPGRIRDAIDYRGTFSAAELGRMATVLRLNPTGLIAVAGGHYPLPEIRGLPFCLYPLRTPHGIGVANGYIVADCAREIGLLFDCGADADALRRVWPARITGLHAVFLTHSELEHTGGLPDVRRRFPHVTVFGPRGVTGGGVIEPQDGATLTFDEFEVRVWQTPGHVETHFCYVVNARRTGHRAPLLVSGDLLFAGSVGGSYFCAQRLAKSLQRVLGGELPSETVVAPGHGPLTTIKNERAFNPFVC
jgi:glyoxylase-like metal-dependent hydrolase (beta-lactamase superfamily II)